MEATTTTYVSLETIMPLITVGFSMGITWIAGKISKLQGKVRDRILPVISVAVVGIGYVFGIVPAESISQLLAYLVAPAGIYNVVKKIR